MEKEKSLYKFNELFIEDENFSEYGNKAISLNRLKEWQFPVPDSVFLSGSLSEKIIEGEEIPYDILKFFKNEFVILRPSPVSGSFDNEVPLLYLGLNDQTYRILVKRVGQLSAQCIYLNFLKNFAVNIFNMSIEDFLLLDKSESVFLEKHKTYDENSDLIILKKYKDLIALKTGRQLPSSLSEQVKFVLESVYKTWLSPTQKILRKVSGLKENGQLPVVLQKVIVGQNFKEAELVKARNFDKKTGISEYLYSVSENNSFFENSNNLKEKPFSSVDNPNLGTDYSASSELKEKIINLIKALSQRVKTPFKLTLITENKDVFLLGFEEVNLPPKKLVEFIVSSVKNGLIDVETGLLMIEPIKLDVFLHPFVSDSQILEADLKGVAASPGAASGRLAMSTGKVIEYSAREIDAIIVKAETIAEDVKAMSLSKGILTIKGGMTSHAAVIARGMGLPCIVSVRNLILNEKEKMLVLSDGNVIREGDEITIDGNSGAIYLKKLKLTPPETSETLNTLLNWSNDFCDIGIRANADTIEDARVARSFKIDGVGLCRTEHMFLASSRISLVRQMILSENEHARLSILEQLLPIQKNDFVELFKEMAGLPVTIRLLDPPLHEFLPNSDSEITHTAQMMKIEKSQLVDRIKDLTEFNPMLGTRGVRLGVVMPEIYEMQAKAIFLATIEVNKIYNTKVVPEIMIPLVSANKEVELVKSRVEKVLKEIESKNLVSVEYMLGVMVETPRAALRAGDIARASEFLSFGTNDLTQMTYGLSRDDSNRFMREYLEKGLYKVDPFKTLDLEGVGELLKIALQRAKNANPNIVTGLCGEHGGDPSSISFCRNVGFDYISCSPYRVPIARLAAAQSQIRESV